MYYLITPDPTDNKPDDFLDALTQSLALGLTFIQCRGFAVTPANRQLLPEVIRVCHEANARVFLPLQWVQDKTLHADGVHLTSKELMTLQTKPHAPLLSVSCHTAAELAKADTWQVDVALLSPVLATPSHPERLPLGWATFKQMVEPVKIPVYALGGISRAMLPTALAHGATGIAGIHGFWSILG